MNWDKSWFLFFRRCYLHWNNSSPNRFWLHASYVSEARYPPTYLFTYHYLPTFPPRCSATYLTTLASRCQTSCWLATLSTLTNTSETWCTFAFSRRRGNKDSQQETEVTLYNIFVLSHICTAFSWQVKEDTCCSTVHLNCVNKIKDFKNRNWCRLHEVWPCW